MIKNSAGILLYRFKNRILEVLIVHPGGPFWAKKDIGAWSIPKGEFTDDEEPLAAAIREFEEELGEKVNGEFMALTPIKQKNGKTVYAFALEGDFEVSKSKSNTFTFEWPPKSGKFRDFPEVDRAEWCDYELSKRKLNPAQAAIIDELAEKLNLSSDQLSSLVEFY